MSTICKYNKYDCKYFANEDYCLLCYDEDKYTPVKKKQHKIRKNTNKASNRMGSQAELINHRKLEQTLNTEANMTPNSGAGKYLKGKSLPPYFVKNIE